MPWSAAARKAYITRVYTETRRELIAALGGRCALCPEARESRLELDHPNGRSYHIERLSRWQRVQRWREEHARGELRCLCRNCNAQTGGGMRYGETPAVVGECS